jgi:protein-S-isoprenylcysteine O-methyltransferase Ste14
MDQALNIAPLLMTLSVRQVAEAATRCDGADAKPGGAAASVAFWHVAYFTILALALWRIWPLPYVSQPWWGYAVMWGGMILRLVSLREIGAYYDPFIRIRDDHRLIDRGPYRWLRHPLHLGLHLEMAGLAFIAHTSAGWAALGLSLLVLVRRNLEEERALEQFFGAAYRDYRRQAWDVIDLLPGNRNGHRQGGDR